MTGDSSTFALLIQVFALEQLSFDLTLKMKPSDPWNRTYIIFYILGIGSLLPWNMFYAGW